MKLEKPEKKNKHKEIGICSIHYDYYDVNF
jgi:hypothetical protein